MDNQFFVYAMDCGNYDAEGFALRVFGRSSLKSFAKRCELYSPNSAIEPILCGVIRCDSEDHAKRVEKSILVRFQKDAPPTRPRVEIRRASPEVLEFIENQMEDGEAFLGMTAYEFTKAKRNEKMRNYRKEYNQRQHVKEKNRNYSRKRHHEIKESRKEYHRKRRQDPDRKEAANAKQRERYQNDAEYRTKMQEQVRVNRSRRMEDPEYRAKISEYNRESRRKRMEDPDYAEKRRAQAREAYYRRKQKNL